MNLDSSSWMSILKKHARIKGGLFLYRKYASKPPTPTRQTQIFPPPSVFFFHCSAQEKEIGL